MTRTDPSLASAEQRLAELGIRLPAPPQPLGVYVEAVRTTGNEAARLAAINALAVVREYLGSLDRVARVVRLGVAIAAAEGVQDHPKVADGASVLLQEVFGKERNPCRLVYGVASLPLGCTVELELILEVVP